MEFTSSLEAGLRVPGNRDEFLFPLSIGLYRTFFPVIVAFPAKFQLVRKTSRHTRAWMVVEEIPDAWQLESECSRELQ